MCIKCLAFVLCKVPNILFWGLVVSNQQLHHKQPLKVTIGQGYTDPFHKGFMSSRLKAHEFFFFFNFDSNHPIRSQFYTCHDSSAVVACAKLWADMKIIFHQNNTHFFMRFEIWPHNPVVEWVPGTTFIQFSVPHMLVNLSLLIYNVLYNPWEHI